MTKKSIISKADLTRIISGIIDGGLNPLSITVQTDGSIKVCIGDAATNEIAAGSGWDDV